MYDSRRYQRSRGWTFDIDSIEYRGYVEIPNKMAVAYQLATAEISGGKGFGFEQKVLNGPKTENYSLLVQNKSLLGNAQAKYIGLFSEWLKTFYVCANPVIGAQIY